MYSKEKLISQIHIMLNAADYTTVKAVFNVICKMCGQKKSKWKILKM